MAIIDAGAKIWGRAIERGVKILGASSSSSLEKEREKGGRDIEAAATPAAAAVPWFSNNIK